MTESQIQISEGRQFDPGREHIFCLLFYHFDTTLIVTRVLYAMGARTINHEVFTLCGGARLWVIAIMWYLGNLL